MSATFDRFVERVHDLLQAGYALLTPTEIEHYNRCNELDIMGGLAMKIQRLIDAKAVPGISRAWCVVDNWPGGRAASACEQAAASQEEKAPGFKVSLRRAKAGALLSL